MIKTPSNRRVFLMIELSSMVPRERLELSMGFPASS